MTRLPCIVSLIAVVIVGSLAGGSLLAVARSPGYQLLDPDDGSQPIQYGPFEPATFTDSSGVAVAPSGALTLATNGGVTASIGFAVLPPVTLPQTFDTVHIGVNDSTTADTQVLYQMRVIDAVTGQLSGWHAVRRESEWMLPAKARTVQVRIVLVGGSAGQSPSVEKVVVDTLRRVDIAPPAGHTEVITVPLPTLTTRAMWGARPPKDPYNTQEPTILTVHHTSQPTQATYAGEATVRGIQTFHMDGRGWSDIGYHFLIGPDGKLFEGRPPTAVGAHAPPNTGKIGISVIGNFNTGHETVTAKQREVLVSVLAHLAGKYGIPTSRIFGHRDTQQTDCPGDTLYADLPAIRTQVDALLGVASLQLRDR